MYLKRITVIICLILFFNTPVFGNDLLITNARIIKGTGEPPRFPESILIRDGKIVDIKEKIVIDNIKTLDVAGATVMAGLIDSHVHLQTVPGAIWRKDNDKKIWSHRFHSLKAFLAVGVTTVLDTLISPSDLHNIQKHLSSGGIGPRVLALGPSFTTPGGYVDDWKGLQPVTSKKDVIALFREFEGIPGIVGVKVPVEYGIGPFKVWPVHTNIMMDIILKESKQRNLPIYVHALSEEEQLYSLAMEPYGMVHAGFHQEDLSEEHTQVLKKSGVYVTTTLSPCRRVKSKGQVYR